MASGSNKGSNKPLTKEEREEEELRNQLMDSGCGFYYDGMSVEEMKMILTELTKTKGNNSQNVEVPPASPLLNESKKTQNTSQVLESNQKPLPSFSYRDNMSGGNLSMASTSSEDAFNNSEKHSPEPAFNKSYRKNLNNEYSIHESELFEKNANSNKDDYPELGNKSNSKNDSCEGSYSSRLRPREPRKPNAAMLKRFNLEKYRLDPLKSVELNAVPLKQPERIFNKQEEYLPYSTEELDNETFEALCQQMSEKLDNLHKHIIANERKTIWGSPIKVPTKWNGPADKNSLMETVPASSSYTTDVSIKDTVERSSKRKALDTIADIKQNYSNDENSEDEFVNTKKRKFQQGKNTEEVPKNVQEDHGSKNNSFDMFEVNEINDSSNSEFDNTELQKRLIKRTKVNSNPKSVANESNYPRRISPPNPSKKNFKGPRNRKKTQSQNTSTKNSEFLDENEIIKRLHESDEMDDNDCIEIPVEIKPSPIIKGVQKRINMANSLLENKKNANEKKIEEEEEARKQKEIKENLKKDELLSKRLQDEENRKTRQLKKEKDSKEKELFYNNVILGARKVTTRSHINVHVNRNYEEMSEEQLLADDDDDITYTHSNILTKSCPICQKHFPANMIEDHASECNLFPLESNDVHSFQPSTSYSRNIYKCRICNKYETYNGKEYEEHVIKCKENAENQRMNGIYA